MPDTTPIGKQIDNLHELREEIRRTEKDLNALKDKRRILEERLISTLEAQGIEQSRGRVATATISKTIVPNVHDWEEFHQYIVENDAMYLLERRASAAAYRELLEQREGENIPGVQPFEKTTLSLRSK